MNYHKINAPIAPVPSFHLIRPHQDSFPCWNYVASDFIIRVQIGNNGHFGARIKVHGIVHFHVTVLGNSVIRWFRSGRRFWRCGRLWRKRSSYQQLVGVLAQIATGRQPFKIIISFKYRKDVHGITEQIRIMGKPVRRKPSVPVNISRSKKLVPASGILVLDVHNRALRTGSIQSQCS